MMCHTALPFFGAFSLLIVVTRGFEIFSEQQTLVLNVPNKLTNYNNTQYGSTHVDDLWTKLDVDYSPLEGWALYRHVRIGCFMVNFRLAPMEAYVNRFDPDITATGCVNFCNRSQVYFQKPLCRCGINETLLTMTEARGGTCPPEAWEVFREYDFRSSMSPATYDVARRLVYQIVTMRIPNVQPTIQYYIHAVNAMEAKPKFEYDTRLERMVFNAVWDFGRSRMVALSFESWDGPLDFTLVSINSSTGSPIVQQAHYSLAGQISAEGSQVSSGLASADGMGTVDILYGTYYTVVPAVTKESPQVVHAIVAIDIETRKVIFSRTLKVALFNLQINSLTHVLYGAGADLAGRYAYYKLCEAKNVTDLLGLRIEVSCPAQEISGLPDIMTHMYLQSATIDHHMNYTWMGFKTEATGRPRILEYQQTTGVPKLWRADSLPLEAAFSSLINTAPRIIFSLYPPQISSAKFSTSGTKIFVDFAAATLRGAIPIDSDGDEIPNYWNNEDKITRAPCEVFFDDFTMALIPGSMCQWTTDANLFIELTPLATIIPGDLVRLRGNRLFAGKTTPSGVNIFSQPSTDFAVVQVPDYIPYPVVYIGGNLLIDTCTPLVLDGSQSKDHGFRGTFLWTLNRTEPETPEPHMREISKILADLQEGPVSPRIIEFPANYFRGGVKYYITLTVYSFFDVAKHTSRTHGTMVSQTPIPPLTIFGASYQIVEQTDDLVLGALVLLEGCMNSSSATEVTYAWIGCQSSEAENVFEGVVGCPRWDPAIPLDQVSGVSSKSLYVRAPALSILTEYIFTVRATVLTFDGLLQNVASVTIFVALPDLELVFYGGNGFSADRDEPIVIDVTGSGDGADPYGNLGDPIMYNFSCEVLDTGAPCFTEFLGPPPTPAPTPVPGPFPGFPGLPGLPGSPGSVDEFRRLTGEDNYMPDEPCNSGQDSFIFRGRQYNEAQGITFGTLFWSQRYCTQKQGVVIIQKNSLDVKQYLFKVNMTKMIQGVERTQNGELIVTVMQGTMGLTLGSPEVVITLESPLPYVTTESLRMLGTVTNQRSTTSYTYTWTVYQYTVNPEYDGDLALQDPGYDIPQFKYIVLDTQALNFSDPSVVRTPVGSRYFAIAPNVLNAGVKYKLRLDVTDTVFSFQNQPTAVGYAEVNLEAKGLPPSGGRLETSALTGTAFDSIFTFSMEGWGTDDIPLMYQFAYVRDWTSEYPDITYMFAMYHLRSFTETFLPPGAVMPGYRLQVIGFVKTSFGAVSSASVELSVTPPSGSEARQRVIRMISEMDVETALLAAMMIVQDAIPNSLELEQIFNAALVAGIMNTTAAPDTPTMVTRIASFFAALCRKGLRTQRLFDNVQVLVDRGISSDYVSLDVAFVNRPDNVVYPLLDNCDCFMPGEDASGSRRLSRHQPRPLRPQPRARSLQAVQDIRVTELQHKHLIEARTVELNISNVLISKMYPGEAPANFTLPGHDFWIGKDNSRPDGSLRQHSGFFESFSVPSMDSPGMPDRYTFRFTQFKKYPYVFMPLPDKRTLLQPADSMDDPASRRIPLQGYSFDERMWHAMSLEIMDEGGIDIDQLVSQSLENATFNVLPRLVAHASNEFGTYDHAATCYSVNIGENNMSDAGYDPDNIVYSDDACVTQHLSDFVVLVDDLAQELELMEESAGDFLASYLDGYRTMAMVNMIVFVVIVALLAAGCAYYVDESQQQQVPIDQSKTKVVEKMDPQEMLFATLAQTFRRDHLLVGIMYKHRKLTREKRVWIVLLSWLSTEAVATLMAAELRFKVERHFVAVGLVAGVLVFPLTQFVQFLYEWRPQTRTFSQPPLGSMPAKPIPLKQQTHIGQLDRPRRPAIPAKIQPPPRGAPTRATPLAALSLPVMTPAELPALQQGDQTKKIEPPPRQEKRKPRPPPGPPPPQHLTARPPGSQPAGLEMPRLDMVTHQAPGPFGLALPQLPPLQIGDGRVIGEVPAPPPKRAGAEPKPPRTPPPVHKMFFAVPNAQRNRPQTPPQLGDTGIVAGPHLAGPKLPPLPKLLRPQELFGFVKPGGDSARRVLPPPPPPKQNLHHFVAPPVTPRYEDEEDDPWATDGATPRASQSNSFALTLPGALVPEELTSRRNVGLESAADGEAASPHRHGVSQDPEHAMMRPPRSGEVPPPPPLPSRGMVSSRIPKVPELPGLPAQRPQVLPGGAMLPRPPQPAGGRLPKPPPTAPPANALVPLALPPLRLAPGEKRIPAMPRRLPQQLPSAVHLDVPAIQSHVDTLGLPPPPPPPPMAMQGWSRPTPPEEGEPPVGVQQLVAYKPPSQSLQSLPKPPSKPAQRVLVPTPPAGPPPAHAIVLAKKTALTSTDEKALLQRVKPPSLAPRPPQGDAPSFVRRSAPPKAAQLVAQRVVQGHTAPPQRLGAAPEKPPRPVPDWVVQASYGATQIFVFGSIMVACFFLLYWGVYLQPRTQWATHGATVTGCIMNMVIFESLKCVVIASVSLVKSEMEKRQEELYARKLRMQLKAQRLQERVTKRRRAADISRSGGPPPPPLMPKRTAFSAHVQSLAHSRSSGAGASPPPLPPL